MDYHLLPPEISILKAKPGLWPQLTWPRRLAKSSSMEAMSVTLVGELHEDRLGELVPCLALAGEGDLNGVLMSSSRPRELLKLLLRVEMDLRGSNLFVSVSSIP